MKNQKKSSGRLKPKMDGKGYAQELRKVQVELCKVQDWVKHEGKRIIIVFEGRVDSGEWKRVVHRVSPVPRGIEALN
jgi:polyphosphate kinase